MLAFIDLPNVVERDATIIFFHVTAFLGFFLVARFFTARPSVAFMLAMTPLIVAWAFQDPVARRLIQGLF